ncbi:MAG: ATP-dependent helicase UvrD/PcrA [Acidobacteria bacterium]|nr:ATP-dependent helicase UvrD/PcrA [Acidobacteriota bacterium]
MPPTNEQRDVISCDGAAFVQACPGAGKTETIIGRVSSLLTVLPPRRGVAVLSFTNAALEEFTRRCREVSLDRVLGHPNFVGTFDAFIRHFLVLPGGITGCTARPNIIESWKTVNIDVRLRGNRAFRGQGVSLDRFDPATGGVDVARIGIQALRNHVQQHQLEYERVARATRARLRMHGTLSAADARIEACQKIRDAELQAALGAALGARFREVLVDEGQDCNSHDLEILRWLRAHGVLITLVADPDQAIYEFRRSAPAELAAFRQSYPAENRLRLTGNFRSTPAICALAATLRSEGTADRSVGATAGSAQPILVYPYSGAVTPDIGVRSGQCISQLLESTATSIVLAHNRNSALRAVGRDSPEGGTSRIETLARTVAVFHSESVNLRARESALRDIELLLLELMGRLAEHETSAQALERHGMNRRVMRRQALEVLTGIRKHCPDDDAARLEWVDAARHAVDNLKLSLPAGQSTARFFRTPPGAAWARSLRVRHQTNLACGTVHEAKGKQFDAVVVVIPPDRAPTNHTAELFTAWETRTELEAKRVVYVAVTRARRLVVLAVPLAYAPRCQAILASARVGFELCPPVG